MTVLLLPSETWELGAGPDEWLYCPRGFYLFRRWCACWTPGIGGKVWNEDSTEPESFGD